MTDTPNEPLLVSAMRRHASNPRVHVRVGVPGEHSSISTTAAEFLAELDAYVEDVKADAWHEGYNDGRRQDAEGDDGPRFTNPYREGEA